MKIKIHSEICKGVHINGACERVKFLCEVAQDSLNPWYIMKEIEKDLLDYLRDKERYVKYNTISGSSKFRIAVFEPGSSIIKAAPHQCICNKCSDELGSCELFEEYHIVNHNLNKVFVRSCNKTQGQLEENDDNDTDDTTGDFIAAGSGHELLWFVHIDIVDTATDVSSDKVGHTILPGQTYITGRYLEKKKEKRMGHTIILVKTRFLLPRNLLCTPSLISNMNRRASQVNYSFVMRTT